MLWNTLIEFGIPYHLVWMLKKLYRKAGVIRVDDGHTDSFKFEQVQGCLISPMLLDICGEAIIEMN